MSIRLCSAHPRVIEMRADARGECVRCAAARRGHVESGESVRRLHGHDSPQISVASCSISRARVGFRRDVVVAGWRSSRSQCLAAVSPRKTAMVKAAEMIRQYVAAGFRKIHLDCSMACAGDPEPLARSVIAQRAARFARSQRTLGATWVASRRCMSSAPKCPCLAARRNLHELAVTSPTAARAHDRGTSAAFTRAGLDAAWPRVIALVVQPGVEFDHHKVIDYRPHKART